MKCGHAGTLVTFDQPSAAKGSGLFKWRGVDQADATNAVVDGKLAARRVKTVSIPLAKSARVSRPACMVWAGAVSCSSAAYRQPSGTFARKDFCSMRDVDLGPKLFKHSISGLGIRIRCIGSGKPGRSVPSCAQVLVLLRYLTPWAAVLAGCRSYFWPQQRSRVADARRVVAFGSAGSAPEY